MLKLIFFTKKLVRIKKSPYLYNVKQKQNIMTTQEINNTIANTTVEIKGLKEWYGLLEIRFNSRMKNPNETAERVIEVRDEMNEVMDEITKLNKVRTEAVKAQVANDYATGKLRFV